MAESFNTSQGAVIIHQYIPFVEPHSSTTATVSLGITPQLITIHASATMTIGEEDMNLIRSAYVSHSLLQIRELAGVTLSVFDRLKVRKLIIGLRFAPLPLPESIITFTVGLLVVAGRDLKWAQGRAHLVPGLLMRRLPLKPYDMKSTWLITNSGCEKEESPV